MQENKDKDTKVMGTATRKAVVQVGQSFAELGLFQNNSLKISKRIYLPQEPLGNALKKFWAEHGAVEEIIVNSHFLEKILDAKLGGTVAQIVTGGFETWPILRQPVWPEHFSLNSKRQAPLASQELIFGISERVSADGKVIQKVKIEELESINEKLKLMSVKRVCVNLLFSTAYPQHQKMVANYFREQGYEVFAYSRSTESVDEMPAWRKNIINACLSGVFTEHLEDIKNSLPDHEVKISFLGAQGEKFFLEKENIASSLFAWTYSLAKYYSGSCDQIIYLGLENWSLISTQATTDRWISPWGHIEIKSPLFHRLKSQPTLELIPGFWGGVDFSESELGYEPGPMSFGRALKPMAYDLLQMMFSLELAQNNAQGNKRLRNHLSAMLKNIPQLNDMNVENLARKFVSQLAYQIGIEGAFRAAKNPSKNGKTLITGYFAKALFPLIQEHWPVQGLLLDPHSDQCELTATFEVSKDLP